MRRANISKSIELQNDLLEKTPGHMDRLEAKLDRIIELLESRQRLGDT